MSLTQSRAGTDVRRPAPRPGAAECSWTDVGKDTAYVRVTGELDLAMSPQLRWTLHELQRQTRLVVLDLREITFIESSAVHVIVDASRRARAAGHRLVLLRGGPSIDRVLVLTESAAGLEIVDVDASERAIDLVRRLAAEGACC